MIFYNAIQYFQQQKEQRYADLFEVTGQVD